MRLTDTVSLVGSGDARLTDPYDCNVYAVEAPESAILVDAGGGDSVPALLDHADDTVGEVGAVLLTHAHGDHSQGGLACRKRGIPVIAGEHTAELLEEGAESCLGVDVAREEGVYPADYEFENYTVDRTFDPPTTLTVAGRRFEAVPLAGHATDHVVYLTEGPDRTYCFVGDAIYPDGSISLLNIPGSSLADYRADVRRLTDRDVDALLPGHGLPCLADGQASIEAAAEALSGMSTPPSRT